MKNKKKAFTLTELLVVVIVIGVLSAAVLPKFNKVIETRKTTEAEELMSSIRTEQEKRCALDKPYLTDLSDMKDIVKNGDTKNYELTLQDKGVIATSKGSYSYNLQMPSYADGRICCKGDYCSELNKSYPTCEELLAKADYQTSPDSCAGTPAEPEVKSCTGQAVTERACASGCGTERRTAACNTSTGNWEYGAWDNSCTAKPASESRECGTGYTGTQTRSAVCKNGVWEMGDWTGTCTAKTGCNGEQPADLVTTCGSACMVQNIPYICKEVSVGKWQWIPNGSQSSGCHLADGAQCSQPGQTKGDCFVYAPGKPQAGIAPTYMQEVCSSSCQWELQGCAIPCPNGTRTDGTCKEKVVSYRWNLNSTVVDIPAALCNTNVNAAQCTDNVNFGEANCRSGSTLNGSTITAIPGYQYGPGEVSCSSSSDVGKFYTSVSVSKKAYSAGSWNGSQQLWWHCNFTQFACKQVEEWH